MGRFTPTTPKTKFHFVLPSMKKKMYTAIFMAKRNFISGKFLFRSHVNIL